MFKFDYKKQDDAKNLKFFKSNDYNAWGILADSFLDIQYMKAPSYEIELKINRIGSSPIYFGATCAGNGYEICRGMIDVTEVFKNKKLAQWASVKIPVSCLQSAGLDSSNMDIRAILLSNDNWDIDLHSIKILATNSNNLPNCSNLSSGISQ